MKFDLKELKKLIDLVEEAKISELSLEDKEGEKISIKKGGGTQVYTNVPFSAPQNTASLETPAAPVNKPALETVAAPDNGNAIKSPMVGTFYASPNPDAAAFVKVGSHISKGDTVCIVE
ncbi:MAG: biotin/lipoyl-containing protein, partial [Candidatus Margulisiibacteriota bacterium]